MAKNPPPTTVKIGVSIDPADIYAAVEAMNNLTEAAERCHLALSKIGGVPVTVERAVLDPLHPPVIHTPAGSKVGRMDPVGRMVR